MRVKSYLMTLLIEFKEYIMARSLKKVGANYKYAVNDDSNGPRRPPKIYIYIYTSLRGRKREERSIEGISNFGTSCDASG